MVESLFHPLGIFILGLGGGFAIPVLYRLGASWLGAGFFAALFGIALISGVSFMHLLQGAPTFEILTAGALPPVSINMRFGLQEGFVASAVNLVACLGALHLWPRLRGNYAGLLLYLVLVMGINGMVMTRDLFNLFVFLEIVSISTYGLLALEDRPVALEAAFKYVIATVVASAFFLLGSALLYYVAGTLNIDALIAARSQISGQIGIAALMLLLAALILELKPFPANGWGLDVYETAPTGVAAMISVGVSSGVFFALFKLLPLFENQLGLIALSGGITFVFSNLIGLKQTNIRRLLGYSSIGQMGLLLLALAQLRLVGAEAAIPLVVGGLFINHLLAKSGLFWLAGLLRQDDVEARTSLAGRPLLITMLALFMVAIAGLPPFPSFWAKWELVLRLMEAGKVPWVGLILAGSLLEAAYLFRWFVSALRPAEGGQDARIDGARLVPIGAVALALCAAACVAAQSAGMASARLFAPLVAGAVLLCLDRLPARLRTGLALATVLVLGSWYVHALQGIAGLFSIMLLAGGLVIGLAGFYRDDPRPGFHPMLAVLLLSMMAATSSSTSLEFFFHWELVTLASCFLIAKSRQGGPHVLTFLLFSLLAAYFLLAGFTFTAALNGSIDLAVLGTPGPDGNFAFVLLAIGFLIKAGAVGVHVWLPGAYAEADDDFSAMLSGVVSKLAMFGLLLCTYLAITSQAGLELAHILAWVGVATTVAGALMALGQDDFKRMLAFSSMSQLGYIVTAIAVMSQLGWVTALYLAANHMMVKGILFLALAGIVLRTGKRRFSEVGGLARAMPFTFTMVVVAVIAMSGLPPLMSFGGKWLLLHAVDQRGWYGVAAGGVLATFLGLVYMARLVGGLFFGPARLETMREAPIALLVPQAILTAGILVLSFFPKLLFDPLAAAIDPAFASTLVWQGMSLAEIYDYWNPKPVMIAAVTAALVLFGIFWVIYRMIGLKKVRESNFLAFYSQAIGMAFPSVAVGFWGGLSSATLGTAALFRRVYTGNGQTYALYVLYYFLALYFANATFAAL